MLRMRSLLSLVGILTLSTPALAAPPTTYAPKIVAPRRAPTPKAATEAPPPQQPAAKPRRPPSGAAPAGFKTPTAPKLDAPEQDTHKALGLPKPRVEAHPNAVVLSRKGFVSIYDPDVKLPLVVSWSTSRKNLGNKDGWGDREDAFHIDTLLPSTTPQPTLEDYQYSGYHRGHMVRQGERPIGVDKEANQSTFSMVNIMPQSPNNNVGPWGHFEDFYRDQVNDTGKIAYVQAGPVIEGERKTIGNGVVVPSSTYKIVVMADEGVDLKTVKPDEIGSKVKVFAVIIPNNDNDVKLGDHWAQFIVPVSQVARRTDHPGFIAGFSEETRKAAWNHRPVVKQVKAENGTAYEVDGVVAKPWVPKAPRPKRDKSVTSAAAE